MHWSRLFIPTLREDPAEAEVASHRLLLHAWRLKFAHPIDKREIRLEAPLDKTWQSLLERFGWSDRLPRSTQDRIAAVDGTTTYNPAA